MWLIITVDTHNKVYHNDFSWIAPFCNKIITIFILFISCLFFCPVYFGRSVYELITHSSKGTIIMGHLKYHMLSRLKTNPYNFLGVNKKNSLKSRVGCKSYYTKKINLSVYWNGNATRIPKTGWDLLQLTCCTM